MQCCIYTQYNSQNMKYNFGYNGSSKNAVWPLKGSLDHSSNNYNRSPKADNPEWVGGRGTPVEDSEKNKPNSQVHLAYDD